MIERVLFLDRLLLQTCGQLELWMIPLAALQKQ